MKSMVCIMKVLLSKTGRDGESSCQGPVKLDLSRISHLTQIQLRIWGPPPNDFNSTHDLETIPPFFLGGGRLVFFNRDLGLGTKDLDIDLRLGAKDLPSSLQTGSITRRTCMHSSRQLGGTQV